MGACGLQSLLTVRPGLPVGPRARDRGTEGRKEGRGRKAATAAREGAAHPPAQPSRSGTIQTNCFCTWRPGASFQTRNTVRTTELELPDFKAQTPFTMN